MVCKQINIGFDVGHINQDIEPFAIFDQPQEFSKGVEPHTVVALRLFNIDQQSKNSYLAQLPLVIVKKEVPNIFIIEAHTPTTFNPMVSPHIDYKRKAALNFYITSNREKTSFYKWVKSERKCSEIESYYADPGESWLIDTSCIHSVNLIPDKPIKILSFSFGKVDYKLLYESFNAAS